MNCPQRRPLAAAAATAVVLAGCQAQTPRGAGPAAVAFREAARWGMLPAGRVWSAPTPEVDRDGHSIWVLERCGANTCTNSTLAPILKFDAAGATVASFGAGMFVFPHGLAVDAEGNVWVTDSKGEGGKGHQVFKFSPDGTLLMTLGKAGVAANTPETFNMPSDVAIAANGDIFVADGHSSDPPTVPGNMRIVRFARDGRFIKAWGKKGSARGDIDDPHGIAIDSKGRVFVADRENRRIQIFDADGNVLDEWKQFGRPSGVYITKDDVLYVAEDTGITIGSAVDGKVATHLKNPEPQTDPVRQTEAVAVDADGSIFAGEYDARNFMKYDRRN